ncbi:hypothetical protein BJ165DRAFT_867287 [Panaeolus papilionaceus]|nr:hypothetical protein BJ165DRAFT_867287 [Panaeolus papilionaceus]
MISPITTEMKAPHLLALTLASQKRSMRIQRAMFIHSFHFLADGRNRCPQNRQVQQLVRIPRCVNLTTQRWPLTRRPKIHHHLPMLTVRRSIPCQKRRQKTSLETMVYTCLMCTAHSSALSLSAGDIIVPINTLRPIADIKSRSSHSHTLTSPLRLTREGGKYPPPSISPSRHAPILHFNLQVLIQSLLTYSSQTLHPTLRLCLYFTRPFERSN